MSEVYTDEQLLDNIRQRAFDGLLFTVSLSDECPIKPGLNLLFNNALQTVDALRQTMQEAVVKQAEQVKNQEDQP